MIFPVWRQAEREVHRHFKPEAHELQPAVAGYSTARAFRTWHGSRHLKCSAMNYRTKAEYFIQGITKGFVEATEVVAWSDEVVAVAPKTEDWMIEISSCGPADRMTILSHLNTIKGEVDAAQLAALLKARGVA